MIVDNNNINTKYFGKFTLSCSPSGKTIPIFDLSSFSKNITTCLWNFIMVFRKSLKVFDVTCADMTGRWIIIHNWSLDHALKTYWWKNQCYNILMIVPGEIKNFTYRREDINKIQIVGNRLCGRTYDTIIEMGMMGKEKINEYVPWYHSYQETTKL